MAKSHNRAAAREREAAKILGSKRVVGRRYEKAPDMEPVVLPSGDRLICECKTRAKLPSLLVKALAQAASYDSTAIPIAVISQTGGHALAVIDLRAFAKLLGIAEVSP
jgi:hypothetical protein